MRITQSLATDSTRRDRNGDAVASLHRSADRSVGVRTEQVSAGMDGHPPPGSPSGRGFLESRFAHDFSLIQRRTVGTVEERPDPAAGGTVMEWRDIEIGGALDMGPDGARTTGSPSDAGVQAAERAPDAGIPSDGGRPRSDAGPGDAGAPGACDPQPLSRAAFLASPGARTIDFGLTRLAGQVGVPVVQVIGGRLQPTAAQLAPLTSVYTRGTFVEGTGQFVSQGGGACPTGTYPMQWSIFGTGEGKIREGEQEHCADFRLAFDLSLNRFARAVNVAAQAGQRFANQQAAERSFQRQLGVAPANWFPHFECLANKTRIRDTSHAHEPVGVNRGSQPPTYPCDRATIRVSLREMHFPRIPGPTSSALITPAGCPV